MSNPDHRRPGNEAASRRNILFGSLAAASALAPLPTITTAAHAQAAIRPASRPSTGRRASFITTKDGNEIYYKDWSKGPPIVLSHGWPLSADVWDNQMMFMASNGFRCVAFDRRGHGRSTQPWEGNNYDTFAEDLSELIGALDPKAATLVGHSAETDFTQDLTRLDVPTLIVHGEDDQNVPIATPARLSSKLIKNATLKVYPGAPHGLTVTHKDQFNSDLHAFSRGLK